MGVNGLSIGVESGDDETLLLANKGYTAQDILEQCRKLEEAEIEYYFVYMTGLAGNGSCFRSAENSARLFNQLNPRFISVTSLTIFPKTKFFDMVQRGLFTPAEEKERIQELQILIQNLQIRTHLFANSKSNFYPTAKRTQFYHPGITEHHQYGIRRGNAAIPEHDAIIRIKQDH